MASSAFGTMPMPAAAGTEQLNYLSQPNLVREFEVSLKSLVQTVGPEDLGIKFPYDANAKAILPSVYASAVMRYLGQKPYVLKELVGTQKVMYSDLSKTDKQWVRNKIVDLFKELRSTSDYNKFSSRIVPATAYNWMEFRTVDCVFAAVVHELNPQATPRTDRDKMAKSLTQEKRTEKIIESEAAEAALEAWVAQYLKAPRSVMEDTRLIYIMEHDLGFKNIPEIARYNELVQEKYRGKTYIVSYEETPGTESKSAFWHTVHVELKPSGAPTITDRQAPALGRIAKIRTDAPCDVWQIVRDSPQFQNLLEAFANRR
ncbi:MAG TPA: hypothetical protein VH302_14050 [Bryobacteraceae bacterium]|jgi:hypothetical protein|nr:hypothetical protein [Bryobacteraceae bacterium]